MESRYADAIADLRRDLQRIDAERQDILAAIKTLEKLAARNMEMPRANVVQNGGVTTLAARPRRRTLGLLRMTGLWSGRI